MNLIREFIPIEKMTGKQLTKAYEIINKQLSNNWKDWIPDSTYVGSEKTLKWELWGIAQDIDGSVLSVTIHRDIKRIESKIGVIING